MATTAATRVVALGMGLVVEVPAHWTLGSAGIVNMATQRFLFAGNGDLASLPTLPGNGDVDAGALPNDRVVVEIEAFCRLACSGPKEETPLPLDWPTASPRTQGLPPSRHELQLGFRWFDRPLFVVAKWADGAPASDIAAIEAIVRSVRADPAPPARGEFAGWVGIGPLSEIPVGSVVLQPLPAGAVIRPSGRLFDNEPYFLARGKENVYAFDSRPLVDRRCQIQFDSASDRFWCAVGGRRYEWTHFGRYLGPEPSSDLPQHRVIVRDGLVWVGYIESSRYIPSVRDEAAEY